MNNIICNDENNPMRECPTINMSPCVQSKGMGGHPGAFTNVHIRTPGGECKIACGKKISGDSIKEFEFYKKLYNTSDLPQHLENLKKFLPTFYKDNKCGKIYKKEKKKSEWFGLVTKKIISEHKNDYFVIDNVMSSVGDNPKNLDFKMGFRTAFQFDKGLIGAYRHKLLDDPNYSTSNKYGFRLEGATDIDKLVYKAKREPGKSNYKHTIIERGKKKQNIALYRLNPQYVFDFFFDSKQQGVELFEQLKQLWNEFLEPNIVAASRGEPSIAFIGSSLLIVKGSNKITFKLIDFAHPLWNSKETFNETITQKRHNKVVENYTQGFRSFIHQLGIWLDSNKSNENINVMKSNKEIVDLNVIKPSVNKEVIPMVSKINKETQIGGRKRYKRTKRNGKRKRKYRKKTRKRK